MVFVTDATTRRLLLQYTRQRLSTGKERPLLSQATYGTLMALAKKPAEIGAMLSSNASATGPQVAVGYAGNSSEQSNSHCTGWLGQYLEYVRDKFPDEHGGGDGEGCYSCPVQFVDFFNMLGAKAVGFAISSASYATMHTLCAWLANGGSATTDQAKFAMLLRHAPLLANVVELIMDEEGRVPTSPFDLTLLFRRLCEHIDEYEAALNLIDPAYEPPRTEKVTKEKDWSEGVYMNRRLRKKRPPVNYAADQRLYRAKLVAWQSKIQGKRGRGRGRGRGRKANKRVPAPAETGAGGGQGGQQQRARRGEYFYTGTMGDCCNKVMLSFNKHNPGLFLLMCHHGYIWGFFFMQRHESPRTPFHVFYNRFDTAPAIIIYDNWCNADKYFRAREPHFFLHTRGYIDRLHFCNHCGCQVAYGMSKYPSLAPINSQVCEQCNSVIKRVVVQVAFMTAPRAMVFMRVFVRAINEARREKLLEELNKGAVLR